MAKSCLYRGEVMHRRLRPFGHRFVYRVFSLLIDIDAVCELDRRLRLFSYNRFNLISFCDRDHGARDGSPLRPWVERQLRDSGVYTAPERIFVHAFPRVLGYVFNPISVYWCHGPTGRLIAVVCEVKNTFGDQHVYVLRAPQNAAPDATLRAACDKAMYVSPFIEMSARYRFRFDLPDDRLRLVIAESDTGGDVLMASHTARRYPLSDSQLAMACLVYPLVTAKIIAAIHWEALKLWLKGARVVPPPAPPDARVS